MRSQETPQHGPSEHVQRLRRLAAERFDAADPATWIARGRSIEHAEAMAKAWRDFPDLPPDAPLEARMARSRDRVVAMRPINEAMAIATKAETERKNFAFYERKATDGTIDESGLAILRGRDTYAYDWTNATCYSNGWYAAYVGNPHGGPGTYRPTPENQQAYDQGFADAGGNPSDLFDAARRANAAALRRSNQPPPAPEIVPARPLPSSWPRPSDNPRPARWERRLLILAPGPDGTKMPVADVLAQIRATPGADAMTVVILTETGFAAHGDTEVSERSPVDQLRALIEGKEFDDILVAAEREALSLIDDAASALPLCKAMERTGHTLMVHRSHLKLWLERALPEDGNVGAGHIRWGKAIAREGLTGKLGEFTVRYDGKTSEGHVILVEVEGDQPAYGFVDANGAALDPRITFGAKARMRQEMAAALRKFGGATRLAA